MAINIQVFFVIIIIAIFGMTVYSAYDKKDKIWCQFIRRDRTKMEMWVKTTQGRIKYGGGYYYVVTRRVTLMLWTKGIHAVIPIWVRSLNFRYDSSMPLDPATGEYGWETPEARANLDKTEDIRALNEGNVKAQGKQKQSVLSGWMPIITIIGFLIIGYMLYTQQQKTDMLGQAINVLQQMLMNR